MLLRARLMTLLVAALCAFGWLPKGLGREARQDQVTAADELAAIPARRTADSGRDLAAAGDDPGALAERVDFVVRPRVVSIQRCEAPDRPTHLVRTRAHAGPRGPPSMV